MSNLAIWTLADGSQIDTQNLPAGQRICVYCMHLHPESDLYFGPLDPARHHKMRAAIREDGSRELECIGCRVHGPHPDMEA
jgi:hypothetical protein